MNLFEDKSLRPPRFRIRTLMIVVVVAAVSLATIVLALRWLHFHDFYISVGPFTIRF
jgi:hypothetical protein